MKTVAYLRVSTRSQDLSNQKLTILDYAQKRALLHDSPPPLACSLTPIHAPAPFSEINRNHKIEIRAASGQEYPDDGPPLLFFRERQLRVFDYMLLMPDENGYGSLMELTERLPALGRGFRRVITDMSALADSWTGCPIVASGDAEDQGI